MNNLSITKVIEKDVKISKDKSENQVEITFETKKEGIPVSETITLTGNGSVKVLTHV